MLQVFGVLGAMLMIVGIFRIIGPFRNQVKTSVFEGCPIVEGPGSRELQLLVSGAKRSGTQRSGISVDVPITRSEEYYFYTGMALIALGFVPVVIQVKGYIIIPKLQALFESLRAAL